MLSAEERAELQHIARSWSRPYGHVMRAKVVLLAADGMENAAIAKKLDLPPQLVTKWRKRYYEEGMEGLEDRPRTGRPPGFSPSGGSGGEGAGM
jgi:transposase